MEANTLSQINTASLLSRLSWEIDAEQGSAQATTNYRGASLIMNNDSYHDYSDVTVELVKDGEWLDLTDEEVDLFSNHFTTIALQKIEDADIDHRAYRAHQEFITDNFYARY